MEIFKIIHCFMKKSCFVSSWGLCNLIFLGFFWVTRIGSPLHIMPSGSIVLLDVSASTAMCGS